MSVEELVWKLAGADAEPTTSHPLSRDVRSRTASLWLTSVKRHTCHPSVEDAKAGGSGLSGWLAQPYQLASWLGGGSVVQLAAACNSNLRGPDRQAQIHLVKIE